MGFRKWAQFLVLAAVLLNLWFSLWIKKSRGNDIAPREREGCTGCIVLRIVGPVALILFV